MSEHQKLSGSPRQYIGRVVRYAAEGSTALFRVTTFNTIEKGDGAVHSYRLYGRHVLGGSQGANLEDCYNASAEDLDTWREHNPPLPNSMIPVTLPVNLSREQAAPLCRLHGLCDWTGACDGDCECNATVQEAWRELRIMLQGEAERGDERSPSGHCVESQSDWRGVSTQRMASMDGALALLEGAARRNSKDYADSLQPAIELLRKAARGE